MATLSHELEKIYFSLNYDTITIYLKLLPDEDGNTPDPSQIKLMRLFIKECDQTDLYKVNNKKLFTCMDNIEMNPEFDRFVYQNDPDHGLYHLDNFNSEETHYHLKCKFLIDHEKLSELLKIAIKYEFITKAEMTKILSDFDRKCQTDIQTIAASLIKCENEEKAIKNIHAYIKQCRDLNTLIYLHQELLHPQYDFLRFTKSFFWRGMIDQEGTMGSCSKTWAHIEKSLELQLVHVLDGICPKLTPKMGTMRAEELRHDNPFFGKKHHVTDANDDRDNSVYSSLQAGYARALKAKYERHFKKMMGEENITFSKKNSDFFQSMVPSYDSNDILYRFMHLNISPKPTLVI